LARIRRVRAHLFIVFAVTSFEPEDRNTDHGAAGRATASAASRLVLAAFLGLGIAPLSEAADSRALVATMSVDAVRIEVFWIETQA
jgi:hypothetical protein